MKKFIYAVLALAPTLAFAQNGGQLTGITNLVQSLINILKLVTPAVFGLAVLFFFYGVAMYVLAAGDAKKASEGKSIMIYGVIAIAVMASLFGLVAFLQNAFLGSTGGNATIKPPAVDLTPQ